MSFKDRLEKTKESLILDSTSEMIAYHDTEHNLIWANRAYAEAVGEELEDIIGRKCYEIWLGRDEPCDECPVDKALLTGETEENELSPVGTDRYYLIRGNPVKDEDGNVLGSIEVALDITERKRVEERLKRSQKIADVGSWELELDTNELMWSDQTYKIFGVSKDKPMDYDKFLEFIHLEDRDFVDKKWKEALKTGEYDIEHRIIVDGETRWVREKADIRFDDEGDPVEAIGSVQDITGQKEIEDRLKESEERYRRLFETAQDGMLILEAETGKIKDANPYIHELLGYSKEELVGKKLWDIGTFIDLLENKERFNELVERGYKRYDDLPLEKKDGRKVPVEFVSNTYKAGGQRVVQCNVRDISERRKAQRELEQINSLLKAIKDINQIIVQEKSLEDIVQKSCRTLLETRSYIECTIAFLDEESGYISPVARTGEHKFTRSWDITLDGRGEAPECVHKVIKSGDLQVIDTKNCGECRFKEMTEPHKSISVPMKVDSKLVGILHVGFEKDVEVDEEEKSLLSEVSADLAFAREKLKTEEKLKEAVDIIDRSPIVAFTWRNEEGWPVEYVSGNVEDVFGYSSDDFTSGKVTYEDCVHPEDRERVANEVEKYSRSENDDEFVHEPYRIITKDDKVKTVKDWTSIVRDQYGDIIHYKGIIEDITEKKNAEDRRNLLHSLLRHDLKNKAQIIHGYLELLEDDFDLPDKAEDYLKKAIKGNEESINLIQKVRLLLGAEDEEKKPVRIADTIHEAVEMNESLARENNMKISIECPSTGCEVEGGSLLKEVFSNLIENSIHHSNGDLIKISGDVSENEVICTIEDDGSGIPKDKRGKIFEKGYTTDKERGSGLGLFLVKMLLEIYGGSIEVKDSETGGARFDVRLGLIKEGHR